MSHARALSPWPLSRVPPAQLGPPGSSQALSGTVALHSLGPLLGPQRDAVVPGLLLLVSDTGVRLDQLPAPGSVAQLQLPPVPRGLAWGSGQTDPATRVRRGGGDGEQSGASGPRVPEPRAAPAGAQWPPGARLLGGRVFQRGPSQLPQRAQVRAQAAVRLPRGVHGHARGHRHLLIQKQRGGACGLHLHQPGTPAQVRATQPRDPGHHLPRWWHLHQGSLPTSCGKTPTPQASAPGFLPPTTAILFSGGVQPQQVSTHTLEASFSSLTNRTILLLSLWWCLGIIGLRYFSGSRGRDPLISLLHPHLCIRARTGMVSPKRL